MIFMLGVWIILLVGAVAATILAARWAWRAWQDRTSGNDPVELVMASGATLGALIGVLFLLAIPTGGLDPTVPDGCYRIVSTTQSGIGVGVGSSGDVTVVPIVTSGRTYTPIACP